MYGDYTDYSKQGGWPTRVNAYHVNERVSAVRERLSGAAGKTGLPVLEASAGGLVLHLAEAWEGSLAVYDFSGALRADMAGFLNGKGSGDYPLSWDAIGLPAGGYCVKLISGGKTVSRLVRAAR
jgi:hypothetical protein